VDYKIFTANKKTEKIISEYILSRNDIRNKLDRLKMDPRRVNGAHQLHGRLKGKLTCWLGSNIKTIYSINERDKIIIIEAVGTHKVY